MDSDAHAQPHSALLLQLLIQPPHGFHHPQGGAHRALAVVFMRLGVAKIYEQTIAQILGDVPFKALDHLGAHALIRSHHFAQLFGVQAGGEGGRIDEVTKQHRELAAFRLGSRAFGWWRDHLRSLGFRCASLLIHRSGLGGAWRAARRRATSPAELEVWRILRPTLWAAMREGRATSPAKPHLLRIIKITAWATHAGIPSDVASASLTEALIVTRRTEIV